jgi:predicted ribosomally synthesized peptide with SipW-like signal peptide
MKSFNKKAVLGTALAGALVFGGMAAYFTDGDTATNTFTVGKVSLDLQEPNYVPATDITPNQETAKDPQVLNDGTNDEYVFVTASIPYANITVASSDGTKESAKADTELFTTLKADGSEGINDGWVEIKSTVNGVTYPYKDTAAGTVTHLYAYGTSSAMTALSKDSTTAPVFSTVRFVNAVEDENLEGTTQKIVVNAYGIQTTNIADTVGKGNADGKTAPVDVANVLFKQAPSTAVSVSENATTDVKAASN